MTDTKVIDAEVVVPNTGFQLTTTTPPVTEAFDRETVGRLILEAIDWDKAQHNTSEKSGAKYATTKAIAFNMTDSTDRRYQISISVNRWEPKQAREPLAKGGARPDVYKLAHVDVAFLNSELVKAEVAGDVQKHGRLMTLKLTNELKGGVDLKGLIELKEAMAAATDVK